MRVISRKFHEKGNVTGVKRKFVERERERRISARIPRDFRKLRYENKSRGVRRVGRETGERRDGVRRAQEVQ